MPVIRKSSYHKPAWLFSRHLETIIPSITRKVTIDIEPVRKRIATADGDFLDIDWYQSKNQKLLILSHGLEGDSKRPYMLGMIRKFLRHGWDVMAWNCRGCSGEPNLGHRFYHSGATDDLSDVISFASDKGFKTISLIGFSLGANLTLKYLGESDRGDLISSATVFSAPMDLAACSYQLDKYYNWIYSNRFLKSLKKKVRSKQTDIEKYVNVDQVLRVKRIYDFDDFLTGPLHGFINADDYYRQCSSMYYIQNINTPTLVVNAKNDPFLSESCYNPTKFESSEHVYLEIPKFGGHVGFGTKDYQGIFWSERRAFEFISQYSSSL